MPKFRGPTHKIITGEWRGRNIALPAEKDVRPTRAAVLAAGMDMLASRVNFKGLTALDVCCGSGQWGLELLSRGADHVTFVDENTKYIAENIKLLAPQSQKFTLKQQNALATKDAPLVDIWIADPPYDKIDLTEALLKNIPLKQGGWWLLETAANTQINFPETLKLDVTRTYGRSQLWIGQLLTD